VPAFTREQLGSFLYKRLYVTAKLPESGEITAESLITTLNNDIDIGVSSKVKGNTATLEIQLDKLTVDRVNRGMADPWDTDSYRNGPAGDRPIKIEVYREVWERHEEGNIMILSTRKFRPDMLRIQICSLPGSSACCRQSGQSDVFLPG